MCKLEENYSQLLCGDRLGRKRKTLEKSAITWLGKVIVTRVNMLQRRKLASSDPGQGPGAVSCEYGKELRGCINGIAEHHRHFRNYVARRWAVTAAHLSTPQNFVGLLPTLKQCTRGFTVVTSLGLQPIPLLHSFQ